MKKAVSLDPANGEYLLVYADFLQELNNFKAAEEIYDTLYDTMPENPDLWLDASALYYKLDDYQKASEILNEGMLILPHAVDLKYRAAGLMYLRGYVQEAMKMLADALETEYSRYQDMFDFFPELAFDPTILEIINHYKPTHGN